MNRLNLYITSIILGLFINSISAFAQDSIYVRPLELKKAKTVKDSVKTVSYPVINVDNSELSKQFKTLNFEAAKKTIQTQITQAKRKKQSVTELENQLGQCDNGIAALQATNRIIFIDSVVVDKSKFLSAYKFDTELGSLSLSDDKQTTSFTSELGNLTYKAEKGEDGRIIISSYFIEDGTLTNKASLKGIELDGDMNYPFLLSDGTTLYFASRSSEGHGNYDIYVTRHDNEVDTYLQPTNLGFPFNSYANDYMMVIDDNLGIGWFASDRNQPEGKVCIYTFINPKSRTTYDYEAEDHGTIINAARINSIKDTWKENEDAIRTARQQLTLKQNATDDKDTNYDFTFIINDNYTYHSLTDFKSAEAKAKFAEYQKKQEQVENLRNTLSELRQNPKGSTIRSQILQIESELTEASAQLNSLAKETRALELK